MIIEIDDKKVTLCSEKCWDKFMAQPIDARQRLAKESKRGICVICGKETK